MAYSSISSGGSGFSKNGSPKSDFDVTGGTTDESAVSIDSFAVRLELAANVALRSCVVSIFVDVWAGGTAAAAACDDGPTTRCFASMRSLCSRINLALDSNSGSCATNVGFVTPLMID